MTGPPFGHRRHQQQVGPVRRQQRRQRRHLHVQADHHGDGQAVPFDDLDTVAGRQVPRLRGLFTRGQAQLVLVYHPAVGQQQPGPVALAAVDGPRHGPGHQADPVLGRQRPQQVERLRRQIGQPGDLLVGCQPVRPERQPLLAGVFRHHQQPGTGGGGLGHPGVDPGGPGLQAVQRPAEIGGPQGDGDGVGRRHRWPPVP